MAPKLRADDIDEEDLADLIETRDGLRHLRVRRRGDLLTLESGPKTDPISHIRFRRSSVQYWTLECATHTGRWERTGYRDTLSRLLDLVVASLPWTIAPIE